MEVFEYIPKGVCSSKIVITINDNLITDINITGGCSGNLKGISKLLKNKNIDDVISDLEGIKCGFKNTSCPDQIAKALIQYKNKRSA